MRRPLLLVAALALAPLAAPGALAQGQGPDGVGVDAQAAALVGLQADGGDIQLVDVTGAGIVRVRLSGACQECIMSRMTLQNGIERTILQEVPGVTAVEAV